MNTPDRTNSGLREAAPRSPRHLAGMTAIVLAIGGALWLWSMREAWLSPTEFGYRQVIVVVAACSFVAALTTELRASGLIGLFEAALGLIAGFFAVIGAIFRGMWNFVARLFGWD
jgi:hypothetical protein